MKMFLVVLIMTVGIALIPDESLNHKYVIITDGSSVGAGPMRRQKVVYIDGYKGNPQWWFSVKSAGTLGMGFILFSGLAVLMKWERG